MRQDHGPGDSIQALSVPRSRRPMSRMQVQQGGAPDPRPLFSCVDGCALLLSSPGCPAACPDPLFLKGSPSHGVRAQGPRLPSSPHKAPSSCMASHAPRPGPLRAPLGPQQSAHSPGLGLHMLSAPPAPSEPPARCPRLSPAVPAAPSAPNPQPFHMARAGTAATHPPTLDAGPW